MERKMVVGIVGFGILTGFATGTMALFAGYSILMALWLYTLFGTLAVLSGVLLICTVQSVIQRWQRRRALLG